MGGRADTAYPRELDQEVVLRDGSIVGSKALSARPTPANLKARRGRKPESYYQDFLEHGDLSRNVQTGCGAG